MFGFVEVITLLLSLGGFGLQPNPKAPTADQALQYAVPDADLVVHFDAQSVIPGNYKALMQLADQPQIKASAELSKMVRQMVNEVEGARGLAKSVTGIDLASDITDATLFLQIVPGREPVGVIAARGKLSVAVVDKIAKTVHQPMSKVGSGAMVSLDGGKGEHGGDDGGSLAVTKDGVLLVGTQRLVKERLADTWKAPARAAGSALAGAADVINAHPVFAVSVAMSPAARKEALAKLGSDKNLAADMINRHKSMSFSIFHDGVGWTWVDSSKAGLDSMAMMSEGFIEVMRAANIAPRGFAKIALGALDSYKGVDKKLDDVIAHKGDLMKIVDMYTGDGSFKVAVDKDVKTNRLSVRATGKSLSEVLPAAMLLPGVGAAVFMGAGVRKKEEAVVPTATPSSSVKPVPPMRPVSPPQPQKRP